MANPLDTRSRSEPFADQYRPAVVALLSQTLGRELAECSVARLGSILQRGWDRAPREAPAVPLGSVSPVDTLATVAKVGS